jgi:hypothetical protein
MVLSQAGLDNFDDNLTDDELAVLPLPGLEDICNELRKEPG